LVEDDDAALARAERLDRRSLAVQGRDARRRGEFLVAAEPRGFAAVLERRAGAKAPRGPRLLALAGHGRLEARLVHAHARLAADIGREIEGKAVGVMQAKGRLAVEARPFPPAQRREGRLEDLHSVGDRLEEALLLEPQHL